jgi:hypothetical protein
LCLALPPDPPFRMENSTPKQQRFFWILDGNKKKLLCLYMLYVRIELACMHVNYMSGCCTFRLSVKRASFHVAYKKQHREVQISMNNNN